MFCLNESENPQIPLENRVGQNGGEACTYSTHLMSDHCKINVLFSTVGRLHVTRPWTLEDGSYVPAGCLCVLF